MFEEEKKITPELLSSMMQVEFIVSSSARQVLEVLNRGQRIAIIVTDKIRIIFGSGNLHNAMEYELGINERDNLYFKVSAIISLGNIKVDFKSDSLAKVREMYGAKGDDVYDYSAIIEMKIKDYLVNLLNRRKK